MESIRKVNFLGALLFLLMLNIEYFIFLGVYYLMYCYVWIYLIFVIQEARYIYLKKISPLKHFTSHWLIYVGFTLPIITTILPIITGIL